MATFAVWFELWASQDCSDDPKRYLLDHRYVPLGLGIGSLLLAVAAWRMVPFADRRRIDLVLVTITTVAALILFLVVGARDFGHGPPGHTFCGG